MALKNKQFAEGERVVCDDHCVYTQQQYCWSPMWLPKQNRYTSKSLRIHTEAKKNECVIALKEVKRLCNKIDCALWMLKFSMTEGLKKL